MKPDCLVIGAGVNGLVAAHTLARAGRQVLVLERSAAAEPDLDTGWIPPEVIEELRLESHGLQIDRPDPWAAVALPDGGRLVLSQDPVATQAAIRHLSPADADRWPEFCARMHRLAGFFESLYTEPPPDVETTDLRELLHLAGVGLRARWLGKQAMIDLLRIAPMPIADVVSEWFGCEPLKAVLAAAGVLHLRQGPRSAGTAFNFLHHHVGSPPGVFRPARSNITAVLAGLPGIELRRGAPVVRILVTAGRATGVALVDGTEIAAPLVVSSADPRATLLDLLDAGWLDPEFGRAVRHIKCRGVAARLTFTLAQPPTFDTLTVAPSLDALERAYDDAKYGCVSREPWIEARAEEGNRVVAHVQYVPHTLAEGAWDDARRNALADTVVARLAPYAPELSGGSVRTREVLTPWDLEARSGLTEGHRYHGEHTLDQILFMRPVPGWGRYRTPIPGLYLAGAGTHPGGAIAGASGRNAARAILKDAER